MGCRFYKAQTDQGEYDSLVRDIAYNLVRGRFTTNPCNHSPECPKMNKEQFKIIYDKIIASAKIELDKPNSKWVF